MWGTSQPPCPKPPSVSSLGPPGACMTPSSVTNSLTTSFTGTSSSACPFQDDERRAAGSTRREALPERLLHQRGDLGRVRPDPDAAGLERLLLGLGRPAGAGDDGAGVAHVLARRRLEAGDVGDDRRRHARRDVVGGLLLLAAADLADHDHEVGVRVGLEARQDVDEATSHHRVAADPDDSALPDPEQPELLGDLVRQRAAAADDADPAGLEDLGGHDAHGRAAGADDPGAVGADQGLVAALELGVDAEHVVGRDALGDADDQVDAAVEPLQDRVGREARRHEDHGGVRGCRLDRVVDGVEDRDGIDRMAGLAGGHAGDDLGAVGLVAGRVEAAFAARDALDDQPGRRVDEDAHAGAPASSTARRAAESMVVSTTTLSGARSASIARPSSSLVPSRRTTIGRSAPSRSSAVSSPSATSSQRVIPPKMLMSRTATLGSLSSTSRAVTTSSALDPPPASRKLAGRPPASATTSRVLMTRPAPLPRMPTSPSSLT